MITANAADEPPAGGHHSSSDGNGDGARLYDPCDVADRYHWWESFESRFQTPEEQAMTLNRFADEYEALSHEPYLGWGEDLAYIYRRMARRCLGLPVGDYLYRHQRSNEKSTQDAVQNG